MFKKLQASGVGYNSVVTGTAYYEFHGAKSARDVENIMRAAPFAIAALESCLPVMETVFQELRDKHGHSGNGTAENAAAINIMQDKIQNIMAAIAMAKGE